jgi:hypothetical protein
MVLPWDMSTFSIAAIGVTWMLAGPRRVNSIGGGLTAKFWEEWKKFS